MRLSIARRVGRLERISLGAVVAAGMLLVAAGSASAIGTLDQSNASTVAGSAGFGGPGHAMGQTFTAGLTGVLDTVQVGICKINAPGDLVVTIEGTYTDALANPPAQVPDDSNVLATQSVPAGSINAPCLFLGTRTP